MAELQINENKIIQCMKTNFADSLQYSADFTLNAYLTISKQYHSLEAFYRNNPQIQEFYFDSNTFKQDFVIKNKTPVIVALLAPCLLLKVLPFIKDLNNIQLFDRVLRYPETYNNKHHINIFYAWQRITDFTIKSLVFETLVRMRSRRLFDYCLAEPCLVTWRNFYEIKFALLHIANTNQYKQFLERFIECCTNISVYYFNDWSKIGKWQYQTISTICNTTCTICMETFKLPKLESKCLEIKRCGHLYHHECIIQWWCREFRRDLTSETCPVCRGKVFSEMEV